MTESAFKAAAEPQTRPQLECEIYSSVDAIPKAEWAQLAPPQDWSMQPAVLAVQESALEGQAKLFFAVIRDAAGTPQACAALALFETDTIQAAPAIIRSAVASLRHSWNNLLRMNVLFCGLPIPDGGHSLRFAQRADRDAVLACLDAQMRRLARQHAAPLLVVKEFEGGSAEAVCGLERHGYIRGAIPHMHRLERGFANFTAYRQALRSTYRRQLDATMKRFDSAGVSVTHHTDPRDIAGLFDDDVHRLYLNVLYRNEQRLERWPVRFFRDLAAAMPGRVVLTLARCKGRPVAFAFGVDGPDAYANLYVGVDYGLNDEADLYFNIFYRSLEAAFERGASMIKLGATSAEFKSRLGAVAHPVCFYTRARSPAFHLAFRALSGLLFPTLKAASARHVFKDQDKQATDAQ